MDRQDSSVDRKIKIKHQTWLKHWLFLIITNIFMDISLLPESNELDLEK
jgi:hypothetical protein